jgi:hypothetical protein
LLVILKTSNCLYISSSLFQGDCKAGKGIAAQRKMPLCNSGNFTHLFIHTISGLLPFSIKKVGAPDTSRF